jgi:hypothetical protein
MTNDVSAIDALSVAVAYCDAVYSDKKAMNAAKASLIFGCSAPHPAETPADVRMARSRVPDAVGQGRL